jgi:hypothetical protein
MEVNLQLFQGRERYRILVRSLPYNFVRQTAIRLHEKIFPQNALVLFQGSLYSVHVIAVSIGH